MISLIICSRQPDIPLALKENIAKTIGMAYELIVIDNSANRHSIFSAYNEGVRRANGDILCFMHEDILYQTNNWGERIVKHFQDSTIGLIGFGGAHFLPSVPVYWSTTLWISESCRQKHDNGSIDCFHLDYFGKNNIVDVVACDGFCFFMPKALFEKVAFDEITYTGFHFYDMDICMQVLQQGYRVCVVNDVLIEHAWSEKSLQKKGMELFETNGEIFFNKWKEHFPISRGIDDVPHIVKHRANNLHKQLYEASQVRKSKAYKIGKFILSPLKIIKKLIQS